MGGRKYDEGKPMGGVKFPTTTEEMEKVFERIGIGSKDAYEYENFEAIIQVSDYTGSLKDLINLTDNLDKYEVYPSIENEEEEIKIGDLE